MLLSLICICSGCSKEIPTNHLSDKAGFLFDEETIRYIYQNFDPHSSYYYGTGIKSLAMKEDQIADGDMDLIPVFKEDEPIFVIVSGKEDRMVRSKNFLEYIKVHQKYVILEAEGNLCLLSADGLIVIEGDETYSFPEELQTSLREIFDNRFEDNLMGTKKSIIKMRKPNDPGIDEKTKAADDHIIVRFREGDRIEQIAKYEEFCHGKAQTGPNTSDIYIFYFDAMSLPDLNRLVEESNKLDYVEIAQLDEQNELIDPVKESE